MDSRTLPHCDTIDQIVRNSGQNAKERKAECFSFSLELNVEFCSVSSKDSLDEPGILFTYFA